MAAAFPLPVHVALDLLVRAHLPDALAAEAALAAQYCPASLAVLRLNGALRTLRRRARAAAGADLGADEWDGCSGDVGEGGAS
ncbi:MAG: hypothetical protein JWM10_2744 [Myxococcaceae bacterium]|nr:hypothetical protein [Myxococcaceae bacterium]